MLRFSFHIFHKPGKDLITADALSRQPLPGHLPEDEELQEEVEHFVRSIVLYQSTTDDRLAKIALDQKLEPTLQNVAFYSKNGWPAKCSRRDRGRAWLTNERTANHCKAIFARHDISYIVISDNGPQFRPSSTSAFRKFASEVGFDTSLPSQSIHNQMVKQKLLSNVKNLMKRNKDPVLALMVYRATPLTNGLSPAELQFGRKIRTMVPFILSSLTLKTVDQSKLRGEEEQRRMAQKTAFDRRHAVTKKAELIAGEKVWVKDLRAWGSVVEKASAPRSYIVETTVWSYRRNSLLLASSQQQVDPSETFSSTDSVLPAETKETPGNELPAEELQQQTAIAPEMKQPSASSGKVSRYGRRYKRVRGRC
ncbi:hypothetical protein LAZ67_2002926 [Cordylochernes scorpioides]|uniref:Integrase catalytic domain-containing protein n=1 Tax=Cordylochernes scorpioides TaxID=51811 RepID=A0ABY6K399_9ARAC|nr:hypothetical protein LAZ67_2002926 [Cordylochernes scorpioides]